jgi:hypothetical protein
MADRIAFIVERLNMSPFHKGFGTMSEFDGKSSLELLEIPLFRAEFSSADFCLNSDSHLITTSTCAQQS